MSILKIASLGHPVLYKKATLVKNITSSVIKKLITDMTETMLDASGIGLAAPQVHVSKQIIIFRTPKEEGEIRDESIEITALINPKLTNISDETDNNWEGCLSIPGMSGLVKRFSKEVPNLSNASVRNTYMDLSRYHASGIESTRTPNFSKTLANLDNGQ